MQGSILEKFTIERSLIFILIGAVLVVFIFIFYLLYSHLSKNIQLLTPNGGEELEIGKTYEIIWKAHGIERVGIVLFKGGEPKWIARNISAKAEKYEWKIYPGQDYGDDYWIAVFEYPWRKGNKIDYSDRAFAIVYSELSSCDTLSIKNEWPYLPSDLPNLRRVFITEERFSGNLEGLEGADQKCQKAADEQGLGGKWQAFLGSDKELAVKRLEKTLRGTDGVFVLAFPEAELTNRKATCHRLLARDFNSFLALFSDSLVINQKKLESDFLEKFKNIWLGRINEKSRKNCTFISEGRELAEKYSFTTTCQNWTQGVRFVEGYPVPVGRVKPSFPTCYTPQGMLTEAVVVGGLSTGLIEKEKDIIFTPYKGKSCEVAQSLLCIEE